MRKIRLGIIGCGGMGNSHLQGLTLLSEEAEISAVCDIVEERAQQAAEFLSAPHVLTDYRDLPELVDAVIVVLPHALHHEVGMFFAKKGKHVLMEKPLCATEAECIELIATAEQMGITLMCAYPVRYWPAITYLKQLIDDQKYGAVFQMSIWTEQYTHFPPSRAWGNTIAGLGGGQLFSHGCHYIDLLLWFLGEPIYGVHIGTRLGTPWLEGEGTSNVTIAFESGALGYHFGTWGARGTKNSYDFQLHCTEGMLEYNHKEGRIYLYTGMETDGAERSAKKPAMSSIVLWENTYLTKQTQFETRHFLDCIRNNTRPLTDGASSLQGLRLIWELYKAEEEHRLANLKGLGIN